MSRGLLAMIYDYSWVCRGPVPTSYQLYYRLFRGFLDMLMMSSCTIFAQLGPIVYICVDLIICSTAYDSTTLPYVIDYLYSRCSYSLRPPLSGWGIAR